MHNHSNNVSPSQGDLYKLITTNQTHTGYNTRIVITNAGSVVYALVVTDLVAAEKFATVDYPPVNNGFGPDFPNTVFDAYTWAKSHPQDPSASNLIADEMAMAFVLDKFNTGVILLKQDSSGDFKRLRTNENINSNGSKTYAANNCP